MRIPFKMDWVVPAAILVAAPNANPAASAQSLFEGVPPIVRSCHEFNSRDWSAAGTASFLKRISCAEPNKNGQDNCDMAEGTSVLAATAVSLAALDGNLEAAQYVPFTRPYPRCNSFNLVDILSKAMNWCRPSPSPPLIPQIYPSPPFTPNSLGSLSDPASLCISFSPSFAPGSWLLRPNPSLGAHDPHHGVGVGGGCCSTSVDNSNSLAKSTISSQSHRGSNPKASLEVDVRLRGELRSKSGKSMIWPAGNGSIIFAKASSMPTATASGDKHGQIHSTVLFASTASRRKRVLRARDALRRELEGGEFSIRHNKVRGTWGWLPWRRRHQKHVKRTRAHLGVVEITIDDRARLEVTVDGTKVLCKSGPHNCEWLNRIRWVRDKSEHYELHVVEDGIQVRLGEITVWGVTADHIMD